MPFNLICHLGSNKWFYSLQNEKKESICVLMTKPIFKEMNNKIKPRLFSKDGEAFECQM